MQTLLVFYFKPDRKAHPVHNILFSELSRYSWNIISSVTVYTCVPTFNSGLFWAKQAITSVGPSWQLDNPKSPQRHQENYHQDAFNLEREFCYKSGFLIMCSEPTGARIIDGFVWVTIEENCPDLFLSNVTFAGSLTTNVCGDLFLILCIGP